MLQKRDFSLSLSLSQYIYIYIYPFPPLPTFALALYPNSTNTQFTVQHQYRKINRTAWKTASSQLILRKIRNRPDVPPGCIGENGSAGSKQLRIPILNFSSITRASPQKWDNLLEVGNHHQRPAERTAANKGISLYYYI